MATIGVLRESSLHASLKELYTTGKYSSEVFVLGFVIDLFDGDQIIEIQTGNFGSLRKKLDMLLEMHRMLIVYPIAVEKYIVRHSSAGEILSRRKSPAHAARFDIFKELVHITKFLGHPNLTFEIIETTEEVHWIDDGRGSWRRGKWSISERVLLGVGEKYRISERADYFFGVRFPEPFTTSELARALNIRRAMAGKMAYCLNAMDLVEIVGKKQRSFLYRVVDLVE